MHGLGTSVVKKQLNRYATWEYHTSAMKKRYDAGIFFRNNETFPNPRGCSKKLRQPKVFDYFPEMKSKINDYCGNPDNQASMSADSVAAEIRQNIPPKSYEDLREEMDAVSDLPSYEDLLGVLHMNRLCPSTFW